MDLLFTSDDGTVNETNNLAKFTDDVVTAAEKVGIKLRIASRMEEMLTESGYDNIKCEVFKLPMGPWPKDRRLKTVGLCHREQFLQGLSGIAMGLFTRILQWSVERVEVYLALVRKDVADPRIHGYWKRSRVLVCLI